MQVTAIVPAAGNGKRMGEETPKQFLLLGGQPLLQHTVSRLAQHPSIREIIVLVGAAWLTRARHALMHEWGIGKVAAVLEGGAERFHTVARGLAHVREEVELVLIHDGVRPFVNPSLIDATIAAAARHGAAIAALPASDCLKLVQPHGAVTRTVDRTSLWQAQTPQVFRRDLLAEAMARAQRAQRTSFDEAQLVEEMGATVQVVRGSPLNIKITTPEDLLLAQAILQMQGAAADAPVLT
ncbi:MAG: 2-C-methyl-D-erythritol 4-phosphate cytidylyltransferase [Candidatus Tectomicrobia bacterium]|nr:2-C-methyl-D-erythritol 4-phosphate cytidylyltransferase [Candidatus Tectomicrobia bacterium]